MPTVEARFHFRNRAVTRLRFMAIAGALAAVVPFTQGFAQTAPRPETVIKWRQSVFQVIAWNTGRIKSALATNDQNETLAAANALAALAGSGLSSLFPAATAQGKGWRDTTARAEIFSDPEKFRALTEQFAHETAELARVAAGSDQKAVSDQFAKVAKTCKSCHDKYRQTD
jgi:cytochrome c556